MHRIERAALAAATLLASALAAGTASAHPGGVYVSGFADGVLHPLYGLDHVLAMVAVGLWAAQMGGRAVLAVPGAFVAVMLGGGGLALAGIGLPLVETGVLGSVVLLGALVLLRARLPLPLGMAMVGLFALFHGHAHGSELPAAAEPALNALGFVVATAALHGLGLAAGLAARHALAARALRLAGGAIAAAGLGLFVGV